VHVVLTVIHGGWIMDRRRNGRPAGRLGSGVAHGMMIHRFGLRVLHDVVHGRVSMGFRGRVVQMGCVVRLGSWALMGGLRRAGRSGRPVMGVRVRPGLLR